MILGVLMGAVAMSSTLVLGTVALICPITIGMGDKTSFCIARFFLIICGLLFLLFVRSGKRITAKEGIILLSLYISFVIIEILIS
jgi:Ca2+/Na+ antiporter